MKLDLGAGNSPREGFIAVDKLKLPNTDVVHDLTKTPWPFKTSSVDEVYCGNLLEYLYPADRIKFFKELYRVLKHGAQATIRTPHWASSRAYGDFDYKFPPISEHTYRSLDPEYRQKNLPHLVKALGPVHFKETHGYDLAEWMVYRCDEFRNFAITAYKEATPEIVATLLCIKEKPKNTKELPVKGTQKILPPKKNQKLLQAKKKK